MGLRNSSCLSRQDIGVPQDFRKIQPLAALLERYSVWLLISLSKESENDKGASRLRVRPQTQFYSLSKGRTRLHQLDDSFAFTNQ